MSARQLRVQAVFGKSLKDAVLLAIHPDESHDAAGDPRPDARTLVLGLRGNRAVFQEELPLPLYSSWYSTSGAAYCGSVQRGTLHVWAGGRWLEERFSAKPIDVVRYIYAVPGKGPTEDTVFVATQKHLFIREGGKWSSKRVPGEGFPQQIEGGRSVQVYVGGPTLLLWDGKKLNELESPDDDSINGLAISADDRLIGGESYVSASKSNGEWERIAAPVKGFFAFARFRDEVFAVSDTKGVLRVYPGNPAILTRPIDPLGLVSVGDGLVAFGKDGVLAFDGKVWTEVEVPACEAGGVPR